MMDIEAECDRKRLRATNAELLEALQEMLKYISYHEGWQDDHPEIPERARATLAKAMQS